MPEMVRVKRDGISYCWNFEMEKIEIFAKETVDVKDCPADVIYNLLVSVSKKITGKG